MTAPAPARQAPGADKPAPGAADSPGLADVIAKRCEQILRYGHTAEADARMGLHFFARETQNMATAITEDSLFARPLPQMRRRAVRLAAFTLALVDRIDAEISARGEDG